MTPSGVARIGGIVEKIAGATCAALFDWVATRILFEQVAPILLDDVFAAAALGEGEEALERLARLETRLDHLLGFRVFRPFGSALADERPRLRASREMFSIVAGEPFVLVGGDPESPVPDAATRSWLAVIAAAVASGEHHYVLRQASAHGRQEWLDFAGMLAQEGVEVAALPRTGPRELCRSLLCVAGAFEQAVVVASIEALGDVGEEELQVTSRPVDTMLGHLGISCIWASSPADCVPAVLRGRVAAIVPPVGYDRAWRLAYLATMAPEMSAAALASLRARFRDVREAAPVLGLATAAASALGVGIDEAALWLAATLPGSPGSVGVVASAFDIRLFAGQDGDILLDRAPRLAAAGAKLLLTGDPGGGKTMYAYALIEAMGRPVCPLRSSDFLRPGMGEMEAALTRFFDDAVREGAVPWIDEIDAFCGQRTSSTSNNAVYVRGLTTEFLRQLERLPGLSIVAACNDPLALDSAVRRRFHLTMDVPATLTPDRERLAWELVLGCRPPTGWRPVGAALSDFAVARTRADVLGRRDPDFLSKAIADARAARTGGAERPGRYGFV